MNNKLLGERIREARESRGISLESLAFDIGLNKSTISRYERGEIENPKLPVIQSIADKLRVNPAYLIGKEETKSYTPSNSNFKLYSPSNLFSPLKTLRKARGLGKEDVAYGIGISKSDYDAIEKGCNTDCITLARLADYFCCDADFLLAYDGVVNEKYQVNDMSKKILDLHHFFSKLSSKDQDRLIAYCQQLYEESE